MRGKGKFDTRGNDDRHDRIVIGPSKRSTTCVYVIYRYIFPYIDVSYILYPLVDPVTELDAEACTTIDDDVNTGIDANAALDADANVDAILNVNTEANTALDADVNGALVNGSPSDDDANEEVYRPALPNTPQIESPNVLSVAPPDVPLIAPPDVYINSPHNRRSSSCG
ncbi:hypothetical protein GOBAR_AA15692 [Gossypium barbadense]|uniref:Uncharacterized protein n=1 Tax=Gossypium barbadense TaxID=3634 RepID=A0A2P5XNN2_GOSBA|nr:hypothetical protein GOBAR_AA15692 [Gossypium barbadense]